MKIVSVTPLSGAIFKENLSYFTAKPVEPGDLVLAPIRGKEVLALVTEIATATDLKAGLRQSDFSLKKLSRRVSRQFFTSAFLEATKDTAEYFSASWGQTVKSFVPAIILANPDKLTKNKTLPNEMETAEETEVSPINKSEPLTQTKQEKYVLQETDTERMSLYKSLIREAFAQRRSVFFCLPTSADIEYFKDILTRGIEEHTIILSIEDGPKKILSAWQKALRIDHPILVIGTPIFLGLPRTDFQTIIIDRENSSTYRQLARPFIDIRFFAEKLAEASRAKLVFGDIVLRSETIAKIEQGDFVPLSPMTYRSFSSAEKQKLINYKINREEQNTSFLAPELKEKLLDFTSHNERTFIFVGRRGLSPLTVCRDCGHILTCPHCQVPLILHQTQNDQANIFLCHKCGYNRTAEDKCPDCRGWRLELLGYGLEQILTELNQILPQAKIWRLDSDSVKTTKKATEIVKDFYEAPGGILAGTEMALYHLREKIDNIAVVGIDSFFTIPEFRISEKVFNLLLRLRSITLKNFLLQTQNEDEPIMRLAAKGDLTEFHRQELASRKKLKYPPYSVLIKISVATQNKEAQEGLSRLAKDLAEYNPIEYDGFLGLSGSKNRQPAAHLLLRLSPTDWPNSKILAIFKTLSPAFIINVDPENIF